MTYFGDQRTHELVGSGPAHPPDFFLGEMSSFFCFSQGTTTKGLGGSGGASWWQVQPTTGRGSVMPNKEDQPHWWRKGPPCIERRCMPRASLILFSFSHLATLIGNFHGLHFRDREAQRSERDTCPRPPVGSCRGWVSGQCA